MVFNEAHIKAFDKKVGKGKTKLTVMAPLTAELARALKVHSVVFTQENMPKPEIIEVELNIKKSTPFQFRLEVQHVEHVLNVQVEECGDWTALQKGTTKKKKPSKLMIQFKVAFAGSALGVFEWLEKYGQAPGTLEMKSISPEQQELVADEPKKGKPAPGPVAVQ